MVNRLEDLLRKAGRELADYQVARFFKIPEEMAQTPCDFIGFTAQGRAILIEAKMVNATSLKIAGNPGLSAHQWNELNDASKAGCISLIAWARGSVCATIPFAVAAELAAGRRSIPWDAIDPGFHRSMWGPGCHLRLLDRYLPLPQLPTVSSKA
jgi:hypothetical protein